MIKPILVIIAPKSISHKEVDSITDHLSKNDNLKNDYHVLVVNGEENTEWDFKGLFPENFDPIKFDELKSELKTKVLK